MGKPPASRLIDKLPAALDVPVDMIKHAVEESRQYLRESEEAAWRAAFKPHAIILTERQRPQPLFVAALIGVDVLLRLDFDLSSGPGTFLAQSLHGLRQRLVRWHGCLPAYGRAVGIIINYGPDRDPLEMLSQRRFSPTSRRPLSRPSVRQRLRRPERIA